MTTEAVRKPITAGRVRGYPTVERPDPAPDAATGNESGLVLPPGRGVIRGGERFDLQAVLDRGQVSPFQGKTNFYEVYTFRSGTDSSFVTRATANEYVVMPSNRDLFIVFDALYRLVYPQRAAKDPVLTMRRMMKAFSHRRTIGELVLYEGMPVAGGIFPVFDINGEPTMYSTRYVLKEHENEGIGTHILERAISLHQRDSARRHQPMFNLGLMTQSWKSVLTLEHLKRRGIVEKIQPLDEPYDRAGKDILWGVHARVWVNSAAIDENGLSMGELSEVGENETVEPPRFGTRGWEIHESMVRRPPHGAGMIAKDGDVIYYRSLLSGLVIPI